MDVEKAMAAFGQALRFARTQKGMSQAAVAHELGVSSSAFCRWETGSRLPSILDFMLICDIVGVKPGEFLGMVRNLSREPAE